jgi:hypothetical protein
MANVSQSICKEMGLPSGAFNKYMTKEIRNACDIISREAGNSLDVLDSKMNELKESHSSYKRERNEWEDRHGN